jgi:hypothetical protein
MDMEKNIALVIANRKKESPPYTFRAIGCNNFPKPLTEESIDQTEYGGANNRWRYDFMTPVTAIIELLPTDPAYGVLQITREVEMNLATYLHIGLKWKLYDEGMLSPDEWDLNFYLDNLPKTSTGTDRVDLEEVEPYPEPQPGDYNHTPSRSFIST